MTQKTLTLSEISALASRALQCCGASERQSEPLAAGIVDAEACGTKSHGLMYLPTYCEHLQCGKVRGDAVPEVSQTAPAALFVDAKNGFAHAAIALGFESLIPLAKKNGVAAMGVKNSYNCGMLGFHAEQLAAAGLAGLGFTNAPASIAPAGGKKGVIGTNPVALAAPGDDGKAAFVIDQSASVAAKSEIILANREGRDIPPDWARDENGQPTTNAAAALKGTMAAAGGYKGFGAGMITEFFAAILTGASLGIFASPFSGALGGPPSTGQFFFAVTPDAFGGDAFRKNLRDFSAAVAAQGRLPGARRMANRERAKRVGVSADSALLARIEQLSAP